VALGWAWKWNLYGNLGSREHAENGHQRQCAFHDELLKLWYWSFDICDYDNVRVSRDQAVITECYG
jgi:hypothetical protein